MNDKERIKRILHKLEKLWTKFPKLRLGQLIQDWDIDLDTNKPFYNGNSYYLPDKHLEKQLDLWIKTNNIK